MQAFDIFKPFEIKKAEAFILKNNVEVAIFSSVVDSMNDLLLWLHTQFSSLILLDHNTPIPIQNLYETPQTLGKDRLAAAIGGNFLYPKTNLLIIDAGTAITYDLVNQNGQYLGGNISPGLQTRFKALNHFTKRLPLLTPSDKTPEFGTNTIEAIQAGVQLGLQFEIEGAIHFYGNKFPDMKVLLAGGDTQFLLSMLKNSIFAEPNLVMIGLNRILAYNLFNA